MYRMFEESWFNQDISSWDVGNVTNMNQMFQGSKFSRDISSSWDKNGTMRQMFLDTRFNRDISSWDVSNVTNMDVFVFMILYSTRILVPGMQCYENVWDVLVFNIQPGYQCLGCE